MEIFEKDDHCLIWGDAIQVLENHINDDSIDLIFADPPYNIGKNFQGTKDKWNSEQAYLKWCYHWLDLCIKKLKPHGSMYVMTATQYMPYIDIFLREKMTVLSRIIWHYDSSGVQAKKYFGSLYEPILFAVKNKNHYTFNAEDIMIEAKTGSVRKLIDYRKSKPTFYNTEKVPGNVWYFPRVRYKMPEYKNHPTQKPEVLLERIIKASSHIDDVILDPFGGSFTTSKVAQKLKRKSISIEIEKAYIEIGLQRLDMAEYDQEQMYFY